MTDQPDCHAEHQEIKGALRSVGERIDQADQRLVDHCTEMHNTLVERQEIEAADKLLHDETEAIAEALLGRRRPEIMGGGRDPKGSLKFKVDELYHQSKNGGIKTKLSRGVVTLLVAIIGAVGVIGQSVFAHRHDTANLGVELEQKFDELRQEIIAELEALP